MTTPADLAAKRYPEPAERVNWITHHVIKEQRTAYVAGYTDRGFAPPPGYWLAPNELTQEMLNAAGFSAEDNSNRKRWEAFRRSAQKAGVSS